MTQPMLTNIKARNLLSFGPDGLDLDLGALNVLIGPNGSGKSNLLETVGLLRGAPQDIAAPIRESGGIRNWIWYGHRDQPTYVEVELHSGSHWGSLHHSIGLADFAQVFTVWRENISFPMINIGMSVHSRVWARQLAIAMRKTNTVGEEQQSEEREVAIDKSILSEVKDPVQFPELSMIADFYENISLYRQWEFGSKSAIRRPQPIDVRPAPLLEDFSNLGMFLNRLRQHPRPKMELFEKLGDIYDGVRDFELNIEGGTVQIFFTEGEFSVPATRLSDGSLRYLCLLAILLDPEPPKLVCIEEPELGFHPDLIPKLADLLVDASSRCQLIVTTHSDALIDALSDQPESVVVCEKHDGQTSMRRLDKVRLGRLARKIPTRSELWTHAVELGRCPLVSARNFSGRRWGQEFRGSGAMS